MDYTQEQLLEGLRKADAAGDANAARVFARMIADGRAMQPQTTAPNPADKMSWHEGLRVGLGKSLVDTARGATQLYNRAAPWVSSQKADEYDQRIAEENRIYNQGGAGDSAWATAGKISGDIAQWAIPGTAAAKGVTAALKGAGPIASNLIGQGAAGAVVGAGQPVNAGDFWGQKGEQVAQGAAWGAGTAAGLSMLGRLALAASRAPGAAYRQLVNRGDGVTGEIAKQQGIHIPPGAASGSKVARFGENISRQSIFSMDEAFKSDLKTANDAINRVHSLMDEITPTSVGRDDVGKAVQSATKGAVSKLDTNRQQMANRLYGEVNELGRGVDIPLTKTRETMQSILDKYDGVVTKEAGEVRQQIAQMARILDDNGGLMNVQKVIRNRREFSKAAGGGSNILQWVHMKAQKGIGAKITKAIEADLDSAAEQFGGDVGAALKDANMVYRAYSEAIDHIAASPLGKLLGEDFINPMSGGSFNSVDADAVVTKLNKLPPDQLKTAVGILEEHSPETLNLFRRQFIQDALDSGMAIPPSAGENAVPLSSAKFLGKLGYDEMSARRMRALFRPKHQKDIEDISQIMRAWGDRTGTNFSGTAPWQEAVSAVNKIMSMSAKGLASAATPVIGARQIASAMSDPRGAEALKNVFRAAENPGRALPFLHKEVSYLAALFAAQNVDDDLSGPENANQ